MEHLKGKSRRDVIEGPDDIGESIFGSEGEMRRSLSRVCYGNLYTIGLIWIQVLKTVLVGSKFSLFPVVVAEKTPEPPKKPPKMSHKDLPIYQSPHHDYKYDEASKTRCSGANTKLLQQALLPHVTRFRRTTQEQLCKAKCCFRNMSEELCDTVHCYKTEFKKTMRDPDKLQMRQGVLITGTVSGYLLGCGGGIPRRTFCTGLGALTAGALCFPKETDQTFRNVSYHAAKMAVTLYNGLCGKNYELRERIPCKNELPPEPQPRKLLCPPKNQ